MNPDAKVKSDPRASIPSVDSLLRELEAKGGESLPRWARLEAARRVLAEARARLGAGDDAPSLDAMMKHVHSHAPELTRPPPSIVVNAQGLVLPPPLGRR